MEINLSDDEKLFLITGCEEGLRNDGRSCYDYRPIILERGVLSGTYGSSRIRLGSSTDVLVGLKLELEQYELTTDKFQPLKFFIDFSANASSQFAGKGGDMIAEDLSAAFNTVYEKPQEFISNINKVLLAVGYRWKIHVDVTVLQCDGNIVDAISLAIIGALSDLEIPEVDVAPDDNGKYSIVLKRPKNGDVRDEEAAVATWKLDISMYPMLLAVSKIGVVNVIDCTPEEEACIRSQLWVGVVSTNIPNQLETVEKDRYKITCIKQIGGGMLESQSIDEMVEFAIKSAQSLQYSIKERLKEETMKFPGHTFLI